MGGQTMKQRWVGTITKAVLALGLMLTASWTHAASITFRFGCNLDVSTDPDRCTGAADYGYLTVSDSATSPGVAVDLSWALSPKDLNSVSLDRILLNYESLLDPVGLSFSRPGSGADYIENGWVSNVGEYGKFDIRIGFTGSYQPLTGAGTLTATSGGLNVLDFMALTPGGNPALYAAYITFTGTSYHGASDYTVPEPETLSLVGLSLLGLASGRRRARVMAG